MKTYYIAVSYKKNTTSSYVIHIQRVDPYLKPFPPACCHLFVVGGLCTSITRIALLAGVFILLLGPTKADSLKDRGQTK